MTYELTDVNIVAWIGCDGTEITKFEVAHKTDSEGKLSFKH